MPAKKQSAKKIAAVRKTHIQKLPAPALSTKPLFVGQPPHKPAPPPPAKPAASDAWKHVTLAPVAKRPPPPPPGTNSPRPLNTYAEGTKVSIQGIPDMQGITIERIGDGGVTVSGGRLAPSTVISGQSPAVLYYERPATAKEPGLTVVVPTPGHGDFSSAPAGGTVTRAGAAPKGPPPPPRPKATGPKREGVCAFIDDLIIKGGKSKEQILELVMAQFPGRDPKATLSTIGIRPTHIRAKGLVPKPFAK